MRPSRPLAARSVKTGSRLAAPFRAALPAALLSALSFSGFAQAPPSEAELPVPQDHPYVLHVYTDLMQIPTLVLNRHGVPVPDMTPPNFKLQIDSGPAFAPTAVHLQGKEPLDIALVLDTSGAESDLIDALPKLPGHGFPTTLLPHDHIAVYAFGCKIVRSNIDTAAEVAIARDGIAHVLAAPALHKPNAPKKTCGDSKHLWDAVAAAAFDLAAEPGRRAILVITDGDDRGSKTPWLTLKQFACSKSIALFALREPASPSGSASSSSFGGMRNQSLNAPVRPEDLLDALTEGTGGLVFVSSSKHLPQDLDRFVALLRSRYIVQFPRPASDAGGEHRLDVHVTERGATVRAAGISVPVRDTALTSDPSTVPSDTTRMPVIGKHSPPK